MIRYFAFRKDDERMTLLHGRDPFFCENRYGSISKYESRKTSADISQRKSEYRILEECLFRDEPNGRVRPPKRRDECPERRIEETVVIAHDNDAITFWKLWKRIHNFDTKDAAFLQYKAYKACQQIEDKLKDPKSAHPSLLSYF
jgi:hypothetical protein